MHICPNCGGWPCTCNAGTAELEVSTGAATEPLILDIDNQNISFERPSYTLCVPNFLTRESMTVIQLILVLAY